MTCFKELQLHTIEIWLYEITSKCSLFLYCLLLRFEHNGCNGRLLIVDFSDTYLESNPTVCSVITWTDSILGIQSP
jgi:hypothetical protein